MTTNVLDGFVGLYENPEKPISPSIDNESAIGLYVDQDVTYNQARFRVGNTPEELTNVLDKFRQEAYRIVTTDIQALLTGKITRRDEADYFIGQNQTGAYLAASVVPANPYLLIKTEYRPGAYVEVRRIALMVAAQNGPVVVPLRVVKEETGQIVHTWDIPVNSMSTLAKDVKKFRMACTGEVYRVEYDFNSDLIRVPDSNYHCSCGNVLKAAEGFILENRAKTYGISLYVHVGCEENAILKALVEQSPYNMVIGMMLRKKIVELTLSHIRYLDDVNRYTLLTPEEIGQQIATYQAEYTDRLRWIQFQKDFKTDGFCLKCKNNGPSVLNLLSGKSR